MARADPLETRRPELVQRAQSIEHLEENVRAAAVTLAQEDFRNLG